MKCLQLSCSNVIEIIAVMLYRYIVIAIVIVWVIRLAELYRVGR